MNDEEVKEPQGEEADVMPITAENDWFLQNLVLFSNRLGIEIGITLQVSGVIVSGTLISGIKYFEEFASLFSGGLKDSPEVAAQFHEHFSSYKKIYDTGEQEDNNRPPPQYIHLREAKFHQPGQRPLPANTGVLWRGRITEVGGFSLGCFSEG